MGDAIASADDVIGHVVNVSARVAETARGGQAVATLDAVAAAGRTPGVATGKPRSRRLKGITDRITLVEISREPGTRRAVSPEKLP